MDFTTQTAAVVVTYNRADMLRKNLEALLNQSEPCRIFVVDNNSSDHTAQVVAGFSDERIVYFNPGTNLGGAGGFNLGIKLALEQKYSRFWLMDDDSLPQPDALAELLTAEKAVEEETGGRYGFLASEVRWVDGSLCRMNQVKFMKKVPAGVNSERLLRLDIRPARQATFVSFLLPVQAVEQAGLPQKEFFIWGDDVEYSRRLALGHQLPCFLAARSKVIHAMKSNSGSDISKDVPERLERYALAYRNESCLYRREGVKGLLYYTLRCIYHSAKVLVFADNLRRQRIKTIWSGYRHGFSFNPEIEYTGESKGN